MGVLEWIIAIATNPEVDALAKDAAVMLVNYIGSLDEQKKAAVLALLGQLRQQSAGQLATANADLASLDAYLAQLQAANDARDHAGVTAVVDQIRERVTAPFVAKPIVTL